MKTIDALAAALGALDALSVPALIRGSTEPDPRPDSLVILDLIASTPYGYDKTPIHVLQVSCYAETTEKALELAEETTPLLEGAGYGQGQSRPAPDDDYTGIVTDWRM